MDKQTQLQIVSDENETLKSDIQKRETDVQEALMKLETAMEEADKSSQRAVKVTEQLDATQASYSELKTELMKLNVQSNQWRIAAEEATTIRSAGNNNNQTNSPYSEDIDDEGQRRKRRISFRRLVFYGRIRRNR
ncbi:Interactor of constitutive active ROPs 3 [Raphanus sativus]|nr:Interactor of constitutive active ROPs 3 [Raphanus sativus]